MSKILDMWDEAEQANTETMWHVRPERIIDLIEDEGYEVSYEEIEFICEKAMSDYHSSVPAIRLLGLFAEIGVYRVACIDVLERILKNTKNKVKIYTVIDAIWQCESKTSIHLLKWVVDTCKNNVIVEIANRAYDALVKDKWYETKGN